MQGRLLSYEEVLKLKNGTPIVCKTLYGNKATGKKYEKMLRFKYIHIPFNDLKKRMELDLFICMQPEYENTEANEINKNDTVNHPTHYTTGKIEVIDFIEDKKLNFNKGNAIKYIARAGIKNKDTEIEDLEKSIWYLEREINKLKEGKI
jgi:Protein of unknwon function (DUF3310).